VSRSIFTQAVHGGERATRPDFTPVSSALHRSVAFLYDDMKDLDAIFGDERDGYVYARYGNPSVTALEQAAAELEGGAAALAVSSGMAAIHIALLATGARAGSAVVAAQDCYGATYTLLRDLLSTQGVEVRFVDIADLEAVEQALNASEASPAALVLETVSNPLMKVAPITALCRLAQSAGAAVIVDNTFATPYLCKPLMLGADIVVHSSTKYFGGHGDVMGGIVISTAAMRAELYKLIKMIGCNLGPDEAWLTLRGLKTLPLRMRQHCENAVDVAHWLQVHPRVARVNYPGLPSHPQHEIAKGLFGDRGFGGMLSFDLVEGDRETVFTLFEKLQLVLPATTLGDVYSLVLYPAMSSHRGLSPEEQLAVGIGQGLVRMSVGIEDVADIIHDLEQALAA
jgi:cystathionine gamma-synthase/methionine-gamma-lyase